MLRLLGCLLAVSLVLLAPVDATPSGHHHRSHHTHHHDGSAALPIAACLGEYLLCPTNDCALIAAHCGRCAAGQYLCPDTKTCVANAAAYMQCPGITGTHLDWTLPVDERVNLFMQAATTAEKIQQLQSSGPSIPRLSYPSYAWANDDIHSINQNQSTVFPDGCGLGASWSRAILQGVGYTVGSEARATHNGLVQPGGRENDGTGITTYSPNINLVRVSVETTSRRV